MSAEKQGRRTGRKTSAGQGGDSAAAGAAISSPLLPNDVGAERDLLLIIQTNDTALDDLLALGALRATDFWRDAHKDFWHCVERVMAQGQGYDPRLVYDEWQRRVPPDKYAAGTFADLTALAPAMGTDGQPVRTHSPRGLAGLIISKAWERANLLTLYRIAAETYPGPEERTAAMAEAIATHEADYGARLALVDGKQASLSLRGLMAEELAPIVWVVPDLLPEGLAMLGAKQKIGKSWMVYALAIAIAAGGKFLGRDVEQGEVLYLALEDGKRRLQARGRKLLGNDAIPDGVTLETRWPRLDVGGLRKLDAYLTQHPATRAVIVDVYARVRPPHAKYADAYTEDYNALVHLKAVADAHHVLILVVHHTRKAAADDVFDELLGSMGLGGACDTLLMLARSRGGADATLHVTGREIEREGEYALRFNRDTCAWQMLGDAKEYATSPARREIRETLKRVGQPLSPKETALAMGQPERYNTIKNTMLAMAKDDELKAWGDGKYSLPDQPEPRSPNGPPSGTRPARRPAKRDVSPTVSSLGSLDSLNGHKPRKQQARRQTMAKPIDSLGIVSDSLNSPPEAAPDYARLGSTSSHSLAPAQAQSGPASHETVQTTQTMGSDAGAPQEDTAGESDEWTV